MILRITLIIIIITIGYLSLVPTDLPMVGNDKISHFIAYGTLMFNAGILTFDRKSQFFRSIILCILYGILIEIGQHFVPGRFMSGYDVVANVAGVVIGCVLTILFFPIVSRLIGKKK